MISDRKTKILWWLVIILAITNLSTFGTLVWLRYHTTINAFGCQRHEHPMFGHNEGDWFMRDMNLTDAQQKAFGEHSQNFKTQAKQLAEAMNGFREQMITEMSAPHPDTTKLNDIATQIGNNHAQLKRITYQYYMNLKSACPHEQMQKLDDSFRHFMQKEGEGRHRKGKGHMNRPQ